MSSDFPGTEDVLLPPQSKETEEAVIGAALINPSGLTAVNLDKSDFYFGKTGIIWGAIQRLRDAHEPIDFMTVSNALETSQELSEIGGPSELAAMINNVPSMNLEAYARIVKEKSMRRALLQQANELARIAYDETKPVAEPVGKVMGNIANASKSTKKGLRHISHGLRDNLEYVDERRLHPNKVWGIKTGFIDYDSFTGGLQATEVTYIAGPPGSGKTKLGTQMICQAALPENGKHPGAIFSMEMGEAQIIKRVVSSRQHISTWQMDSGIIPDEVYEQYLGDIEYLESLPIYISDAFMNPHEFHAELAFAISEYGIEDYLLDYLLLMSGYEDLEETARSGVLSRLVKQCTKDLGLAGITVATTNKEIFNTTDAPSMKTVRGSANVVFDADNIAILTPCTAAGKQSYSTLTFVKTRNVARPVSQIYLQADSTYPIFKTAMAQDVNLDAYH